MSEDPPHYLDTAYLAGLLGRAPRWVLNQIRAGDMPGRIVAPGRSLTVRAHFDAWLAGVSWEPGAEDDPLAAPAAAVAPKAATTAPVYPSTGPVAEDKPRPIERRLPPQTEQARERSAQAVAKLRAIAARARGETE